MRLFAIIAFATLLGATQQVTAETEWTLIWSDEFNGDSPRPDPAKWNYEHGKVRNNEAQFYTWDRRKNARVENGKLIIEARKEPFENSSYTAASITTNHRFSFQYGRIEISAKVPHGRGVWPALWMLGDDINTVGWPRCGELDIMEYVGHEQGVVFCNVHATKKNGQHASSGANLKNQTPWAGFHTYAMEWDEKEIKFYYDSTEMHAFKRNPEGNVQWAFDRKMYLLMNIAIGGSWGGQKGIDDDVFPAQMEVDFVRVYQKKQVPPAATD